MFAQLSCYAKVKWTVEYLRDSHHHEACYRDRQRTPSSVSSARYCLCCPQWLPNIVIKSLNARVGPSYNLSLIIQYRRSRRLRFFKQQQTVHSLTLLCKDNIQVHFLQFNLVNISVTCEFYHVLNIINARVVFYLSKYLFTRICLLSNT